MSQIQTPMLESFFSLDQLSGEQRQVVDAVVHDRCNVIVNAVAGSGKTRTALVTSMEWVSSHVIEKDVIAGEVYANSVIDLHPIARVVPVVLLVAYNRLLMEDMVKQRDAHVPPLLRGYIEIRTIHSLGRQYFGGDGITKDGDLYKWMKNQESPKKPFPPYRLVIIDEAQDLNPILFNFLHFVLARLRHPQLLILGDPFQLLYRFNGADERFILEADERFAEVAAPAPFKRFKLSICFRITHEMANWVNIHLNPNNLSRAVAPPSWCFDDYRQQIADWWGDGIRANPRRPPAPGSVTYCSRSVIHPRFRSRRVINEIIGVLQQYDSNNFALLSFSVSNEKSPAREVTNSLGFVAGTRQSWFIDTGKNLDEGNDSSLRRNKRIASTIHKFKGRECDAIVLVGFDGFYETMGNSDPRDLFNVFYVAATRARMRLHIIQWNELPFATYAIRGLLRPPSAISSRCLVTQALEYCGYNPILCEESPSCLTARTASERRAYCLSTQEYTVPGSHHAYQKNTLENISAIIGFAIEIRLQLILDNGKLTVPQIPEDDSSDDEDHIDPDLRQYIFDLRREAQSRTDYSWTDIMKISTAFLTLTDGYYSRWRQIRKFSRWAIVRSSSKLDQIIRNLVHLLYVPFCAEELAGEWDVSLGSGLSQDEDAMLQTFDDVPYKEKVDALKALRREGRILFHGTLDFPMRNNKAFVERYGELLSGEMDITLISKETAQKWKKLRKYRIARFAASNEVAKLRKNLRGCRGHTSGKPSFDPEEIAQFMDTVQVKKAISDAVSRAETNEFLKDNLDMTELVHLSGDGTGVSIVEVKATSRIDHTHMLQVGCYGAMWREAKQSPRRASASQKPDVFSMENDEIADQALSEVLQTGACTFTASQEANECPKMPKMFLVYPNLGLLRQVQLGMDSEEYLHRIGFRKVNLPFDPSVLRTHLPDGPSESHEREG